MTPVRVLLAGFSGLGRQDHQSAMYLPAFRAHPGFEVVGTCGTGAGGAVAAADLGVPAFEHLHDALDKLDASLVSVCAPVPERAAAVTAALRAGRHVLVDKPAALTVADATAIAAAASSAGLVCVPAHHFRFHPSVRAARAALGRGRIGLPWNVQADLIVAGGDPVPEGEIANFAVYPLDVITALTGQRALRVHALAGSGRDPDDGPGTAGGEDTAVLLIDYEHGMTAAIVIARRPGPGQPPVTQLHRYRISGSHGTYLLDLARPAITVYDDAGTHPFWPGPGTVDVLLDTLRAAVTGGGPAEPGPEDIVAVAGVLSAARESLRTGAPAEITNPGEPS